jgi:chorismate mutase
MTWPGPAAPRLRLAELRAAVDRLDRDIQRLAARRRELSQAIQELRLDRGGTRHDPAREAQVVGAYVAALGPDAASLAEALLRLCRGPVERAGSVEDRSATVAGPGPEGSEIGVRTRRDAR